MTSVQHISTLDPPKKIYDPFEPTLGLRHRDIQHQLEILSNAAAPKASKIKALHTLTEVIPGRQHEADMYNAIEILRQFLMQPPNGLLLNALVVFNGLINTADLAKKLIEDVPRIVELLAPEMEKPIRKEAAQLLRCIAEHLGPEVQFQSGYVPSQLAASVSYKDSDTDFLLQAFRLLSRLTNKQNIRAPLIDSTDFLRILVESISNPELRAASIILASNIAMDPTDRGKLALLNAEIIVPVRGVITSHDQQLRLSAITLLALLAVPKDGKHMMATDQELPRMVSDAVKYDPDEKCRDAARGLCTLIIEHPVGKAIFADYDIQ